MNKERRMKDTYPCLVSPDGTVRGLSGWPWFMKKEVRAVWKSRDRGILLMPSFGAQ